MADCGFNCIKLTDDWGGVDFLAYHKDGQSLKVQLKARLTISKKYLGKELFIAFPNQEDWYMVKHDLLVKILKSNSNYLNSESWKKDKGDYSSAKPSRKLLLEIACFKIG